MVEEAAIRRSTLSNNVLEFSNMLLNKVPYSRSVGKSAEETSDTDQAPGVPDGAGQARRKTQVFVLSSSSQHMIDHVVHQPIGRLHTLRSSLTVQTHMHNARYKMTACW